LLETHISIIFQQGPAEAGDNEDRDGDEDEDGGNKTVLL